MRRMRPHLTYANVVSTICLFVVLGGSAYAAFHLPKDSVKSKNIVNGQVKQADVSKTLTVSGADFATNAGHATNAGTATSASNATNASNAANAAELGGQGPSAYALAGAEAVQPADLNDGNDFGGGAHTNCYWTNYGNGQNDAGSYRDRAGVIHLQGLVVAHDGTGTNCGDIPFDTTVFELPGGGYVPANQNAFATISNNLPARISVMTDGQVNIEPNFPTWANAKQWVSLDGLSFRCAPSGQDGCP
jgi:hypothetical protein